ncbi:MAG: plasmid mobilization relaxosome protein MobC [Lachnospiraceae bacterium]|nr:plasmid mobilization relaxosome protein MobC [Lachnospiraceae bacterium]
MKRKKKYNPENRNHVITVRMNDEEWKSFQSKLEQTETSQSDFIRQAITTAKVHVVLRPVYDSDVLNQIAAEYGKIGSNINQIAKHLNKGNPMTASLQKSLNHCIADLNFLKAQIEKMAGEM